MFQLGVDVKEIFASPDAHLNGMDEFLQFFVSTWITF
jgi:hypothetical protein